jgi:hypothetical protein
LGRRDEVDSHRALALCQVEVVSRTLLQCERIVDERQRIAACPGPDLLNRIYCGGRVGKIDDEGCGGDASGGDLGMPLRQPRGIPGQERDCEPLGSESTGDRGSNAGANTRDDDDWLHGIRLRAGATAIDEVSHHSNFRRAREALMMDGCHHWGGAMDGRYAAARTNPGR